MLATRKAVKGVILGCSRVFQMWHFVKKKNCDASTIPSRAYINHIQKNFFPRTSLEGRPTWSKIGHPGVSICRKNLFFNNNTTPVNSLRGSQERLQHFFFVLTLCLSLPQTPINWSPRGLYLSEFTQIIWVSQFRYLSPLGDNFELFGQIFKYFIEETTKNQPGTNLGQLKNRFLRQIETPGWPIFDQVGRPSRLLEKNSFGYGLYMPWRGFYWHCKFFFFYNLSPLKLPNVQLYTASKNGTGGKRFTN